MPPPLAPVPLGVENTPPRPTSCASTLNFRARIFRADLSRKTGNPSLEMISFSRDGSVARMSSVSRISWLLSSGASSSSQGFCVQPKITSAHTTLKVSSSAQSCSARFACSHSDRCRLRSNSSAIPLSRSSSSGAACPYCSSARRLF